MYAPNSAAWPPGGAILFEQRTYQTVCTFRRGGVEPNPFILCRVGQIDSNPTFLRGCSQGNLQPSKLNGLCWRKKQGGQSALPGKEFQQS